MADSGLVSRENIDRAESATKENGTTLGGELVAEGLVSEDELHRMEAYVLGIPFLNLKDQRLDYETLSVIPEPIARTHNIVAVKKTADALEVAMLDTDDLDAINFLKKKTRLRILARLTDRESMKYALLQYQKSLKAEFGDIIKKESEAIAVAPSSVTSGEATPENVSDLKKVAEDLPIVRIVDALISHAISQSASDIHIEPMEKETLIRYRLDGVLHDAMVLPKTAAPGITARIKVLANLRLDEKRLPQDGRFKTKHEGENVSFRVSLLPTYYGEKIVMRLLRETATGFPLDVLGFHGVGLERLHEAIRRKTGIVLITGPTGSGKTTTLYTLLDILNTPEVNISTIEDPIEYQIPRINQTQVKPDIGFTFAQGLRTLLRQDPDIMMVGEIRDNETASLAVNAALTGHLVLSTLHTNSAAGAIPRLIDMKVEPFLIASVLKVVIGQRLVRKLCSAKEKYTLKKKELDSLTAYANIEFVLEKLKEEKVIDPKSAWADISFHHPKKSQECEDGFKGRLSMNEVLLVTDTIRALINSRATDKDIEKEARSGGMMTMMEDGVFKAAQGTTTLEEVLRVVSE